MSRIRSIKPEFWTSEQVLECSTNARLLFLGLWNFCDDEGRHPYSAKQAKAEVFPADRFSEKDVLKMLEELFNNGLIARYQHKGKEYFYVTGWKKHQRIDKPQGAKYPDPLSKDSTIIPGTFLPDTIGEEGNGDDTLTGGRDATRPDDRFEDFWEAYPKRDGANPKEPARKKFTALVKSGVDPGQIIAAAERYAAEMRSKGQERTPYVAQAVTWLTQRRHGDYGEPEPPKVVEAPGFYAEFSSPQIDAWAAYERAIGKSYPRDKSGGWRFPAEWPPGHKSEAA